MMTNQKPSKVLNISLWIGQVLVAVTLLWAAYVKLVDPVEKVAAMWPWAGEVSPAFLKFTGLVDLAGGLGLLLPALLNIKPRLTPIAAVGVVVLMVCASVFHVVRGEASSIGFNIVFGLIAAFIAWGRFRKS